MNLQTLKNIINQGGATLNNKQQQKKYKKGYQVSKKDLFIINIDLNNLQSILNTINSIKINNNEFIGLWIDDNKMYIDLSIKINNLKKAIKFGKNKNQLSIYDWQNQNCIYLKA